MFLSTAYLTSLATLVLIIYVINPPVKDAIQGAYFVGIFMCGIIFGGGALIFQDITEGLGCLLGGFALSMWFLTLKSGGLVTSTAGKAIFIAAFCITSWSLSFSHYTRTLDLIGSTSFAGSTALVLGIDCFSRAGLKEFWIYIWHLNGNIFPLDTSTYPITKGICVETVVIMLATIIGVISQVRLWRVVRKREKAREAVRAEDERRRDAVEEALGRHLERQNDKDRSEWERRYGDRLNAKRNTILWSEAQSEKTFIGTSITELEPSQHTESSDSLEMTYMALTGQSPALCASKSKRQSNFTVQAIAEVEEDQHDPSDLKPDNQESILTEQPYKSSNLDLAFSTPSMSESTGVSSGGDHIGETASPSLRPQTRKPSAESTEARLHLESNGNQQEKTRMQPSTDQELLHSLKLVLSKSPAEGENVSDPFDESKEALVKPSENRAVHSCASSIAATFDEENEELELPTSDSERDMQRESRPPQIVISPVYFMKLEDQLKAGFPEPPSPTGLSEWFEDDPEAISRPPTNKEHGIPDLNYGLDRVMHNDGKAKDDIKVNVGEGQTFGAEGLTKGALESVPNQMSDVVLSYRTNEWAKHIATADAPIFEEPDSIIAEDKELPTHLITPVLPISGERETETQMAAQPPKPPSPVVLTAPSEAGVKVNPDIQPIKKVLSRPMSSIESPLSTEKLSSCIPAETSILMSNRRSLTDPVQQVHVPKSTRRISNPLQRQSTLQGTTIDENTATNFTTTPHGPNRSSSRVTSRNSQQYIPGIATPDLIRSTSSGQHYPSAFKRQATPIYSQQSYGNPDTRPATAHTSTLYSSDIAAVRPKTRLHDYNNTHQPLQRNNTVDSNRRSALITDWRAQMAKKEQDKYMKTRKEEAWDQTMRTRGMIDAHREALKKMQSQANKRLTR